mmetsp:Transcript_35575/g.69681  ORF Transcript_35575/g.69681 Transcript_35575/m.69681 type:complete len:245 (+) Transcript_35575:218-952(+)
MAGTNSTDRFLMDFAAPAAGAIFSSSLALGPMPAVLEARRAEMLGDVNPDVFPVLFVNCVAWCIYSVNIKNSWLFFGNIAGVLSGFFYLLSAYGLSAAKVRQKLEVMAIGLAAALVLTCFAAVAVWEEHRTDLLGFFANAIVFAVFSSPLSTFGDVIKTKNSASINRPFGIIQVFNCIVWVSYALYIHDNYLLVPNLVGLVLGVIQVFLMVIYPATVIPKASDGEPPLLDGDVLSQQPAAAADV